MAFPVDILTNVDHESLEVAAEEYMSQLLYKNPDTAEYLSLPDFKQIEIGLCNVSFVPLYGADSKKKLLALSPDGFTTVVGLYLLGQWWGVEDVLKTADPSRTGLIEVSTLGERIVLYVLNRIVLRHERSSEDVSFLCHCEHESAKILWKDGEAIGFYSYKPKGSLCRNFLTKCYQLPVMDTLFIRKCHRGKSYGVKILEDFVDSFRTDYIGLKFPLSGAMYKVCEKYFSIHPADTDLLWEVEKIGSPFQRTLIANRIQMLKPKIAEKDQVVSNLNFEDEDVTAQMEITITKVHETTEHTMEIVEETITDITKEVDDIPVTTRGRGSSLKRRGVRDDSEERLSKNIIRVEDIEAGVESPIEAATEEHPNDKFSVKESETVLRSTTDILTSTVTKSPELRSSQKEEEQEIEKDITTSDGTPVTHLTIAGEINSQRGSEEECEMINLEHTVIIQGATIGSIDQSQLQSVVDIEIVKMSTGTEEEQNQNLEKNKEVEEDKPVCEPEKEGIKQMLDEPEKEKSVKGIFETYKDSEALEEVTDQSGTLANKAVSEECKEKETDSTMDATIIPVGESVGVSGIYQEDAPQQSSVESAAVHKMKTTPEEDEETVENSSKMLTLSEAKVVLVDLHKLSPKKAIDDIKTSTEQVKEDAQNKESTDPSGRSTNLQPVQPISPGVTVRCLRTTLKPVEVTLVRRSTRSKAVIQQIESVKPQEEAKFRTDENPQRDEVIAHDVGKKEKSFPEESEKANTNADERVAIESGSSELLKATEIDYKDKTALITEATEGDIPLVEAEPDDDITEVKEIKKMENMEINVARHTACGIEMSSLVQENDAHEEEAEVSTERSLRRRAIRVQCPLRRKSRRVQKQEAEPDVEHQERHTVVTKNKTEAISMTEERVEEMDHNVNKMENKEANSAELEPVEEPDMIRNEDGKTSASTEESVNICLPIITMETSFESVDDMANTDTVETAAGDTEKSELLMAVEIDDQEKEVEPDKETKIVDGTRVVQLRKVRVVLVDLNKLTQNIEEVHSQMEEHTELDKPDKSEQELCNLASEEEEQEEEIQTQEDTEMILGKEKNDEENTSEEQDKLDKQDKTFEEQKPTDDLDTMPTQSNLVEESTKNENETVSGPIQEQEKTETVLITERSADKVNQECAEIDEEKTPQISTVEATEKVIPFVEAEPEEDVIEKEAKEISKMESKEKILAVTKDSDEEAPETREEANLDQQKNEPLVKNEKGTAETETPMEMDPVVSKGGKYVVKGTTIQIEGVSQLESTETNQSDNSNITRRSLRLSAKSVTSTQNTQKSMHLHKTALEPVKEANVSRNEYEESSANTEGTVVECIPVITAETNFESPYEIPNTNVQKTSAVGPEISALLMCVETEDKKETPTILEEVTMVKGEPDKEVEKDDSTPVTQLQKDTVVLVDLNNLSQSTEGESDTPEVLTYSQTEEQLELDEPEKSEYQLCIQTLEHEEQQEELQKEENTPEKAEDKIEKENTVEEQNKHNDQDMRSEEQKITEIVKEYKSVIDEDVEEAVKSKELPEATTMADETIKETDNYEDISLKEKQADSDVEMSSFAQGAPEAVQNILEEEVPVSTERSLRHRKIKVQSLPKRKSRRIQEAEADVVPQERHTVMTKNKTEATSMTEKTVEKTDQEVNMKNKDASLAELEPVKEDTDKIGPLVGGEPDEGVLEKRFEEIKKMESKETSLEKDLAPEMGREEANLEQHENESMVNNASETTHLHTSELEPVKEADMSRNEATSMTAETVNVCVPIITVETNIESLDEDGDMVSMRRNVERGKVVEALPEKSTRHEEEDETLISIKTTENEMEMDKTQKVVEGGVQDEEKAEHPQDKRDQKLKENVQEKGEDELRTSSVEEDPTQHEAVTEEENVGRTNAMNEFKTTVVEGKLALEHSDQEVPLITRRSLRNRTVMVQYTPKRKSKRLHGQEVESDKETKGRKCEKKNDAAIQKSAVDLNIPIEKGNEPLNAEESITAFENLETKEGEGIIQVNIEGKAEETGTKDDTVKEGNEILLEIDTSNSADPENTEQNETQEENLERNVQVPKELEEEKVAIVQEEDKSLQERENEGGVQGSSFAFDEISVERRSLRKRETVERSSPRKSKRLRKQEHDEDSEQVKEAVIRQTESVEVTFTEDHVELSSDVPAAVFESSNLGGEIQQKIQKNAEDNKSDGGCNAHEDIETDASESQEEQKETRVNKPQTDEDNEEVMEQNSKKVEETREMEEVIEQHVETEEQKLESSTIKGFTLDLEVEETSDQEGNKADEISRVSETEAPKEILTPAEKSDEGEENISDEDEKGLAIEKHALQSSSSTSITRRSSSRLQIHESKKNTEEEESDSESEVQQTAKQRHQRKRKAKTDLTPARKSKRF